MIEAWLDVLTVDVWINMVIACALRTGVLQADATHEVTFSVDRHYIRSSWDRTKATGRGACGDLWSM